MTSNLVELRSPMAQDADSDDPDAAHCARCGHEGVIASVMIMPLGAPPGTEGYGATICDTCVQRVLDLLVNPHLLVTVMTTNPNSGAAEVQVDGAAIDRPDAVELLHHAANMLDTPAEIITIHQENENPS